MPRPESEHLKSLRAFRERLVDARRAAAADSNLDTALERFTRVATAIALVDTAIDDELTLTPLPAVDDPTKPAPFPDSDKGPPLIETI